MPSSGRLLVVEDETLIALTLEELAREEGWEIVGSAASEAEAFELLGSTAPSAAVLDIKLGHSTSFAVAAACHDRGIPVLFVTGYLSDEVQNQCGAAPIVTKPFAREELKDALRRVEAKAHARS
jgi:CheY-like chemotaxis protein